MPALSLARPNPLPAAVSSTAVASEVEGLKVKFAGAPKVNDFQEDSETPSEKGIKKRPAATKPDLLQMIVEEEIKDVLKFL